MINNQLIPKDALRLIYLFRYQIFIGALIGSIFSYVYLQFNATTYTITAIIKLPNLSSVSSVVQDDQFYPHSRFLIAINNLVRLKNTKVEIKDNVAIVNFTSSQKSNTENYLKTMQELEQSFITILQEAINSSFSNIISSKNYLIGLDKEHFDFKINRDIFSVITLNNIKFNISNDLKKYETRMFVYKEILEIYKTQENIEINVKSQNFENITIYVKFLILGILCCILFSILLKPKIYFHK